MPFTPGARFGSYEIAGLLGAGGMGEVYRARDSKLGRDVALKILPDQFASDPDRVARFQREAQLLASLNHPHIAAIYGLEEVDQGSGQVVRALVLELVEGPTLAERIAQGALPAEEALPIAVQIADALQAAHEKGVVHRDLKPANVKVTPDGTVKVLDFGLAKMLETQAGASSMTMSPTLSVHATYAGVILGTASYMSPEQARGKAVDKRSDVWSFGCVLYEMLTGHRPFPGEEISDTLAFVITKDPDWSALPAATPAPIRRLLRRCFEKDPRKRLQDVGDARLEIKDALDGRPEESIAATPALAPPPRVGKLWPSVAVVLALVTIALGFATVYFWRAIEAPAVARFTVSPPDKTTFGSPSPGLDSGSISPDGRRLVFSVREANGSVRLWMRALDSLTAQPLPGTEGAAVGFWSPDSRFIGFNASDGKLKKVDAAGGPPLTLCGAPNMRGASWSPDGTIVFAPNNSGPLSRVSAAGGEPVAVTKMQPGDRSHRLPWFLPDGRHFLFFVQSVSPGLFVGSLDSTETKRLLTADTNAVYAPPGYLLFDRQGTLLAQPFDAEKLTTTGDPFPIAEQVGTDIANNLGAFSASLNGVLTYRTGGAVGDAMQMSWFDRQGKMIEPAGPPAPYRGIDLSADGTRVAAHRHEGGGGDIWLFERTRGTTSRFTFDASVENVSPIWSPDSSEIVFGSLRGGSWGLYKKAANGASNEDLLLQTGSNIVVPMSWSRDGKAIVYQLTDQKNANDLWVLPLGGDGKPVPFAQTPFSESHGQISPDGRWLAYLSNETGAVEVYVRPFPSGAGKWQISTSGGQWPRWRGDGRELFYMGNDAQRTLFVVDVKAAGATFEASVPKRLFETRYVNLIHGAGGNYHTYAVSADGQRFLIPRPVSADANAPPAPITVVLNWAAGIRK